MKIYFPGSILGGRDNLPVCQHIVERLQAAGHAVPSAHVADPDVLAHESNLITGNPRPTLTLATHAGRDELDARLDSFLSTLA